MEPIKSLALPLKMVAFVLTMLWVGLSWIEAEKEVRILCGTFVPGQPLDEIVATLETGHSLRYRLRPEGEAQEGEAPRDRTQRQVVSSYYNGLRSACTVTLENGLVAASAYRTQAPAYVLFGE